MTNHSTWTASLVKSASSIKAHLVEPVLTAVVQSRFTDIPALNLVTALVQAVQLKVRVIYQR